MFITYEGEPTSDLECGGTLRVVRETDGVLALVFRNGVQNLQHLPVALAQHLERKVKGQ